MRTKVGARLGMVAFMLASGCGVARAPAVPLAAKLLAFPRGVGTYQPGFDGAQNLGEFHGLTSHLTYAEMDLAPTSDYWRNLFDAARTEKSVMQIGFEENLLTNADLSAAIRGRGLLASYSKTYTLRGVVAETVHAKFDERNRKNLPMAGVSLVSNGDGTIAFTVTEKFLNQVYAGLAGWRDFLRARDQVVLLRPMSEMNDWGSLWELSAEGAGNTPSAFAQAWMDLHGMLALPKTLFCFNVASWNGIAIAQQMRETLTKIEASAIDAVGIHPYAGATPDGELPSFKQIVDPWIEFYVADPRFRATPRVIGEMGAKKNRPASQTAAEWDQKRADWIRGAFAYARELGIPFVTYFLSSDGESGYGITSQADPLAFQALQSEIDRW